MLTTTLNSLKISQGKSECTGDKIIHRIEDISTQRVFKGYSVQSSEPRIKRVFFKTFAHYEQFKRAVDTFNRQVLEMQSGALMDLSESARNCVAAFKHNST